MAKGITETDVHTAADEIITAGERPTVERIRAHLGTGSPNTVTRWLDTWWKQLGERLQKQQAHRALPQAPDALAFLAGEWWSLAMEHARANAEDAISQRRAALQAEQAALNTAKEAFRDEEALLRHQAADAAQLRELAQARAVELERLVHQLQGQNEELARQCEAAHARVREAETQRQVAEARLQTQQDQAASERDDLIRHVRAVEDRAHAEVDRGRQEVLELKQRLASVTREHDAARKAQLKEIEAARTEAADARRDAAAQRARAEALDAQLARFQDLPSALHQALEHANPKPKPQRAAKRSHLSSGKQPAPPKAG